MVKWSVVSNLDQYDISCSNGLFTIDSTLDHIYTQNYSLLYLSTVDFQQEQFDSPCDL